MIYFLRSQRDKYWTWGGSNSQPMVAKPLWQVNFVDFAARLARSRLRKNTLGTLELFHFVLMVYHFRPSKWDLWSPHNIVRR